MYYRLTLLFFAVFYMTAAAQTDLAFKLEGSWQVVNSDAIENWQVISPNELKGSAYKIIDGEIKVLEELRLEQKKGRWTYTARVLNQNDGRAIKFKQIESDDGICFDNPDHDFPQKICYEFLGAAKLRVTLSAGDRQPVTINMERPTNQPEDTSGNDNPEYDPALAERLGADDYGMKMYVLVILKTGNNDSASAETRQELFRGHMNNIGRLVDEGKMIVAGPLGRNEQSYRGIFIMNMTDVDEVREMMQTDPAIAAGVLDIELFPWYGSAALPEYLPISDKIWKKNP